MGTICGSLRTKHSGTADDKTCTTQESIGKRVVYWDLINNV